MADPEEQPEQQHEAVQKKTDIATKVTGTVKKWSNVKSSYEFINRNDTKDVFVQQGSKTSSQLENNLTSRISEGGFPKQNYNESRKMSWNLKMEPPKNDTKVQVNPSENTTKHIEWNVDMNVVLSGSKNRKLIRRIRNLLVCLVMIVFAVVISYLTREIQTLQVQIHDISTNLVILKLKYDKLEKTDNFLQRGRIYQSLNNKSQKLEKRNLTDLTDSWLESDNNKADDHDDHDDLDWKSSEYRAAGARRDDDGRGPLIATFVGARPEQLVTDSDIYIGPWVTSSRNESRYDFNKFHLDEGEKSIEVTTNGLYMISTQIFYFGESTHYSYWILLSSGGGASGTQKLTKCATVSAITDTEVSCHTSVIIPLKRGDRIRVQQQERNRLINLREGHSYIQIALLTSDNKKRIIS